MSNMRETNRISVDIDTHDHRLLKSYCARHGIKIKEFVASCVIDRLEEKLKEEEFQHGLKSNSNNSRISHSGSCC